MNKDRLKTFNLINNMGYNKTIKQSIIETMVDEYDLAHKELITRFSVVKNTVDGKDVSINFSKDTYRGVVGVKKKEGATSKGEKTMQLEPNLMHQGDYLSFKMNEYDEVHDYLVTSDIERKNGYDEGVFLKCNNILVLNKDISFPCYMDDSSYGQKGVIDTNYITYTDGQVKILIQDNKWTRSIPDGYRFIFKNSYKSCYEVVKDSTETTGNIRRIMVKKTKYMPNKDDLENNIAYNTKKLELNGYINDDVDITNDNKNIIKYKIKDSKNYIEKNNYEYDCVLYYTMKDKFYVVDKDNNDLLNEDWTITSNIDDINKKGNIVNILKQEKNYIEIKCYGNSEELLILNFEKDNNKLTIKVKLEY